MSADCHQPLWVTLRMSTTGEEVAISLDASEMTTTIGIPATEATTGPSGETSLMSHDRCRSTRDPLLLLSRRESGGAGPWNNQNRDRIPQRRDYRDNYGMGGPPGGGGQRRERYSPADRSDMSPPMKRMRGGRDWDDRTPFPNYELGSYAHHNNWNQMDNSGSNTQHRSDKGLVIVQE